jgi:TP53 regulating kinase-like protein
MKIILYKRGAEADLYLDEWYDRKVIIKMRVPKSYRHPKLDLKLRTSRTIREAEILHEAKKTSVPTPTIYFVDEKEAKLVIEYIDGIRIKEYFEKMNHVDLNRICQKIGMKIGLLHKAGLIHGDLTTSNMIITRDQKIFLIDFGLSFHSQDNEDRGVDIHLMKRALDSTHYKSANACMKSIINGYAKIMKIDIMKKILARVNEIEDRGRYSNEKMPT